MHSELLSPLFSTTEMQAALADEARIARMLAFEAALAQAEAAAGIVPEDAAAAIAAACQTFVPDIAVLAEATRASGNPAIPFVKALTAHCPEPGRGFVHWGATSQDLIDTASVLLFRQATGILDRDLIRLGDALAAQAERHRTTLMPGRTLMQPALPITLGFKLAGWLDLLARCRSALRRAAEEALVLQFGGAVGTLAALGAAGEAVRRELGRRLDLPVPDIAWHTARDRLARLGGELAVLSGALSKMAGDVALLMQAETAEAFEPASPGRGGSSTMPQKRNPVAAAAVRAAALRSQGLVASLFAALPQEHERALGGWQAEWVLLPGLFDCAAGALRHVCETVEGLEVDAGRMRANLEIGGGTLMSEALMMALAPRLGRQAAHHKVEALARKAIAEGGRLAEVAARDPAVVATIGREEIATALDPGGYVGLAEATVEQVVGRWKSHKD